MAGILDHLKLKNLNAESVLGPACNEPEPGRLTYGQWLYSIHARRYLADLNQRTTFYSRFSTGSQLRPIGPF